MLLEILPLCFICPLACFFFFLSLVFLFFNVIWFSFFMLWRGLFYPSSLILAQLSISPYFALSSCYLGFFCYYTFHVFPPSFLNFLVCLSYLSSYILVNVVEVPLTFPSNPFPTVPSHDFWGIFSWKHKSGSSSKAGQQKKGFSCWLHFKKERQFPARRKKKTCWGKRQLLVQTHTRKETHETFPCWYLFPLLTWRRQRAQDISEWKLSYR